jgi:plastocyanin
VPLKLKRTNMKKIILAFAFFAFLLAGCQKEDPGTNEVILDMNKFSPSSLTVSSGTTITWTNKESVTHTVTSNTALFESGDMGKNDKFSFTFSNVGTYPYHCKHHGGMNGTIIVE